jgi:hypothetical protein
VYFFCFAFLFLYYYLLCLVLPDHNFFQLILPYPSERFCFAYPSGDPGIGWAGHLKTLAMIPSLAPLAVSLLLFGSFNVAFAQQENDPGHTTAPYYPDNPICYVSSSLLYYPKPLLFSSQRLTLTRLFSQQNSWLFVDVISNCNQFGMECVCSDVKTWYEFVYYAYQACDSTDGDSKSLLYL